jgi:alkylhydroperoxidase family enzyme
MVRTSHRKKGTGSEQSAHYAAQTEDSEAQSAMSAAVWDPEGEVSVAFKRLIAYVASSKQVCNYCMAHNAGGALKLGVSEEKLAQIWEFRTSALFSEAERIALEFALAAAAQPNEVTDELFDRMKQHWTEGQIVEITAIIAWFGFMNRWNDTMATPLEDEAIATAEKHIARHGWKLGIHAPD